MQPTAGSPREVLLDTDLGTDVDDAYALACLVGSPDVSLLGLSTVYGDTILRARLARRLLGYMRQDVECVPGVGAPLSGAEVWLSHDEGVGYPELEAEVISEKVSGPEFLVDRVMAKPGRVDVVAIGPLTNIADAIRREPGFAAAVRTLWIMGGRFDDDSEVEHNFRSDADAAEIVFQSEARIVCIGVEVTRQVKLWDDQIAQIGRAGLLGEALERDTRAWMARWSEDFEVPHDAVLVVSMLLPHLFSFRTGEVTVHADGPAPGRSTFADRPAGRHQVASSVDALAVGVKITELVSTAGTPT